MEKHTQSCINTQSNVLMMVDSKGSFTFLHCLQHPVSRESHSDLCEQCTTTSHCTYNSLCVLLLNTCMIMAILTHNWPAEEVVVHYTWRGIMNLPILVSARFSVLYIITICCGKCTSCYFILHPLQTFHLLFFIIKTYSCNKTDSRNRVKNMKSTLISER